MTTVAERLTRIWETPKDTTSRLSSVDHKTIGTRYIITALVFFVLAGLQSLLIRTQLAEPNNELIGPNSFDALFTMHGTTMIFFFATPLLSGFGNYFMPLMIGARDMAFPRLNAFGYWVFLLAGVFLYSSYLIGQPPNGGWFAYVPLTSAAYSSGPNLDFWLLSIIFLTISSSAGAINFIVTTLKMRAPGMSLNRIPLFVWAVFVTAWTIITALPPLTAACVLLFFDRRFGTMFYNALGGGAPLLWQHLFWAFGHPDVYIIFLPAVGIVSEIVQTFSRRTVVAYTAVAMSAAAIAFLGLGVWVHHMFATGINDLTLSIFSAASMMIAIPSAVQIFAWLATIWTGRPRIKSPMLFVAGFVVLFVMGGVTGVMFAVVPFDWQITDSYFVVAHFHYVLFGGMVFPAFGALHYWYPKMTGKMLSEKLGTWTFWLMFIGFNVTFFPMHILGLLGMPRRVYTYDAGIGWSGLNMLATIGAFVLALGILLYFINAFWSYRFGDPSGSNPWGGGTLEWATTSPPPVYNFARIPTVRGRQPLWQPAGITISEAALDDGHEAMETTILDAQAQRVLKMPSDSVWPLLAAFGLFIGFWGALLWLPILLAFGAIMVAVSGIGWLWPKMRPLPVVDVDGFGELPTRAEGPNTVGWWGMVTLIATEAMLFISLLSSYMYIRLLSTEWPLKGIDKPELLIPSINTALLITSSIFMIIGEQMLKRNRITGVKIAVGIAWLLGALFLILQINEYRVSTFGLQDTAYGSLFFTITGFHGMHVAVGLLFSAVMQVWLWRGLVRKDHPLALQTVSLYWHFVDVVWLFVFTLLYLTVAL